MMSDSDEIQQLEEIAANAWPAAVVQIIDGWRLCFNWGVTHRANSVWANRAPSTLQITELLATVDDFYRRRDAPPMYRISPATQPAGLESMLANQGYRRIAPTAVQTAEAAAVLRVAELSPLVTLTATPTITDRWSHMYAMAEGINSKNAAIRRGIAQRIGPPARFVLAEIDGQAVATGFGVLERGWVGMYSMTTSAEFRGQGAATAILHDLAAWAEREGAGRMYLQVTEANQVAIRLYQRLGFSTWYHYHYREGG